MQRPDRAEKLQDRKNNDETVVVMSLGSLFKPNVPESLKQIIRQGIEKRVYEFSFNNHMASLALNLLVRECYEYDEDLPCFWDPTFLRQLHLGTENAQAPDLDITLLFNEYPEFISTDKRSIGDRNIYSSGATMMSTNIKNHLVTNFERVLKKYLYEVNDCSEDEGAVIMSYIYGWKSKRVLTLEQQFKVNLLVEDLRELLYLDDSKHLGPLWFKTEINLYTMLDFFVHVNRWMMDESKTFPILPVSGMNLKHINLDSFSMKGVFTSSGIDDFEWNKYFDIDKIKVSKKTFTGTISTNGVSVNVHFWEPKQVASSEQEPINLEGKRVISNDPGRTNIYYMAEETKPEIFKYHVLTRKAYYQESGINKANVNSSNWNRKVKEELEQLSNENKKSLDVAVFKMYLSTVMEVRDAMWVQYGKKKWRQQKLRLYGGKKRVYAKFFNKIEIDDNTVFAYGAAKFSSGAKKELSVPTATAYKECAVRAPVILVDEFRTTKAYWKTGEILQKVATKTLSGSLKTVRGLLWCGSTKCGFINRDKNAAINILRCATLPQRPTILNRSLAKEKLVQRIAKIIKNKLSYTT
jgi:hypothetical protein